MDTTELRVRLIEAAVKTPAVATMSTDEVARRVLEVAQEWEAYVVPTLGAKVARERAVLGLPK